MKIKLFASQGNYTIKQWSSNLFYAGLILFCLTLPFGTSLNNIAILVLIAGWLGESTPREKLAALGKQKLILLPLIYFLFSTMTMLYSDNTIFGMTVLETQIKLLLFPLLFATTVSITKSRRRIVLLVFSGWCILLALILLGIGLTRFKQTGNSDLLFYYELTEPIQLHAIYMANYLTLSALIVIFTEVKSSFRYMVALKALIIIFIVFVIGLLSSLSVMLFVMCFTLVMVNWWLYSRIGIWKSVFASVIVVLIILGLSMSMPYTRNKVVRSVNLHYEMDYPDSAWNTFTIRMAKWKCGWAVVQDHFLAGTGVGDEMDELRKSYERFNFKEGIRCNYNVHNQYLSAAMSGGIILFILLVVMLTSAIWIAIRNNDLLAAAFVMLMIFSLMTENFFHVQKGVTFFSFFYALFLSRKN